VSGLEKRLPHQIGQVSKNKVPANAILLQTIAATIPVVLIWFVFGAGGNIDPNTPYFALLASANVIWGTSMVLLFADIFFVKKFYPDLYGKVRSVPDGVLKLCGVLGILASAVAVWATFAGPWYPPGFTTAEWRFWVGLITVVSAAIGVLIYVISEATTRRGKTEEQLIAEAGTPSMATGGGGSGE
jgi:hypothetical protein